MLFELSNNLVRLKLEGDEPVDILVDLQQYFSYNDTNRRFEMLQRARGQEVGVDLTDVNQVKELAYMCTDNWYQRFLCYTYNLMTDNPKPLYNFVKKEGFTKTQMSDGWKSILQVDYTRKSVVFEPGLLRLAMVFLQDQVEEYGMEWDFKVKDTRKNRLYLTPEPVYEYNGVKLRDYQRDVVDRVRQTLADDDNYGYLFDRIMLDLSVNFGKTLTLYVLCKNFTLEQGSHEPAPVVWFYSDRELLAKAVHDYLPIEGDLGVIAADRAYINKYLSVRGQDSRPDYYGKKPFTLAMIQTLHSRIKAKKLTANNLGYYAMGVYDECHKGGGQRVKEVIGRFRFGALVGASGSPLSSMSGEVRFNIMGRFGGVRHSIEYKDTVEMGRSLPLEVWRLNNQIPVRFPTSTYNVGRVKKKGIWHSDERFALVRYALKTSLEQERQTLIYGGNIQLKYLKSWYERLKDEGFDLDYTFADDPDRVDKILRFSERKSEVLFSNKIVGTGIDISTIGALIYLVPTDNEIDILQAPIGRLGRVFKDENPKHKKGIIWDFFDDDTFVDTSMDSMLFGDGEADFVPGELTRISQIRKSIFESQNIPVINHQPNLI